MTDARVLVRSWRALLAAHWGHLVRFGLVGLLGMVVNTAVLAGLVEIGGWARLVGALVATEVAILTNFALNDCWTLRGGRGGARWLVRAGRYNVVACGELAVSLTVLTG